MSRHGSIVAAGRLLAQQLEFSYGTMIMLNNLLENNRTLREIVRVDGMVGEAVQIESKTFVVERFYTICEHDGIDNKVVIITVKNKSSKVSVSFSIRFHSYNVMGARIPSLICNKYGSVFRRMVFIDGSTCCLMSANSDIDECILNQIVSNGNVRECKVCGAYGQMTINDILNRSR